MRATCFSDVCFLGRGVWADIFRSLFSGGGARALARAGWRCSRLDSSTRAQAATAAPLSLADQKNGLVSRRGKEFASRAQEEKKTGRRRRDERQRERDRARALCGSSWGKKGWASVGRNVGRFRGGVGGCPRARCSLSSRLSRRLFVAAPSRLLQLHSSLEGGKSAEKRHSARRDGSVPCAMNGFLSAFGMGFLWVGAWSACVVCVCVCVAGRRGKGEGKEEERAHKKNTAATRDTRGNMGVCNNRPKKATNRTERNGVLERLSFEGGWCVRASPGPRRDQAPATPAYWGEARGGVGGSTQRRSSHANTCPAVRV
jgi:hypothetical protein